MQELDSKAGLQPARYFVTRDGFVMNFHQKGVGKFYDFNLYYNHARATR